MPPVLAELLLQTVPYYGGLQTAAVNGSMVSASGALK